MIFLALLVAAGFWGAAEKPTSTVLRVWLVLLPVMAIEHYLVARWRIDAGITPASLPTELLLFAVNSAITLAAWYAVFLAWRWISRRRRASRPHPPP